MLGAGVEVFIDDVLEPCVLDLWYEGPLQFDLVLDVGEADCLELETGEEG